MRLLLSVCLLTSHARAFLPFLRSNNKEAAPPPITPTPLKPKRTTEDMFEDFVEFLQIQQHEIIQDIETNLESSATFSSDPWGLFSDPTQASGGITRVISGGEVIEKGACSFTMIRNGILTAERAATIRSRQNIPISDGDEYAAAALSMVLHSKSPMVPTFRSDVRVFLVKPKDSTKSYAWLGGGADLTPYYLFESDIRQFHTHYADLCATHSAGPEHFSYPEMKTCCDEYFYLPARQEHRGTGGIFFDDRTLTEESLQFTKDLARRWMPSWFPIVKLRRNTPWSDAQKYWQKLRRGRYLEFNLLYDRGVKFGLLTPNPRVEGIMVSAPPEMAFAYNYQVDPDSPEGKLERILKAPIDWV